MPCSYAFYTEGQQYCSTKMVMLVTHFKSLSFPQKRRKYLEIGSVLGTDPKSKRDHNTSMYALNTLAQ